MHGAGRVNIIDFEKVNLKTLMLTNFRKSDDSVKTVISFGKTIQAVC